jgi:hypothetical protein
MDPIFASSALAEALVKSLPQSALEAWANIRRRSSQKATEEFIHSAQGKRASTVRFWCRVIALICVSVAALLLLASLAFFRWSDGATLLFVLSPLLLGATALGFGYLNYRSALESFVSSPVVKSGDLNGALKKMLSDISLPNLINLNRQQVTVYHDITTRQAQIAARNSQVAMSIGFLILVAGAIFAIRTNDDTSKLIVGALASIGSIMSGYIGRTFLTAQQRAMEQLYKYWKQPLSTSYLLNAERLAKEVSEVDSRDQMLIDVIAQILNVALLRDEDSSTQPLKSALKRTQRRVKANNSKGTAP